MKKILIGVFAAVAMVSCKTDRSDHPHIDPQAAKVASVTPLSPINHLELKKNMANAKVAFNWSAADYGFAAAVKYVLQADVKGGDFSRPVELALADEISAQITVDKLNGILIGKFKFEPAAADEPAKVYQFDVRVGSRISGYIDRIYSAPYTINVITYQDKIIVPSLGVPGNYVPVGGGATDENWAPGNMLTRVWDFKFNGNYVGYINLHRASDGLEFKFVDGVEWGKPEYVSPTPVLTGGIYQAAFEEGLGGNILGMPTGYYQINVTTSPAPGTLSMLKFDSFGIVGDAAPNGWDEKNPTLLTYNNELGVWELKGVTMKAGKFLFLVNKSWGNKFAVDDDGVLTYGGPNDIPGPGVGKYDLIVDLKGSTITHEFIPQ